MKTEKSKQNLFFKPVGSQQFQVTDEKAELLYQYWFGKNTFDAVNAILSDASIWGSNLNKITGLCEKIVAMIENLQQGVENTLQSISKKNN
jgi:mannitol-1-phosphate/altronate dehydrogenase